MKRVCLTIAIFLGIPGLQAAQLGVYQRGTIVRMRVAQCLPQRGFIASLSGTAPPPSEEPCPEYTLVGDKVVYVIVGKMSNDLLPLAEMTNFRFQKNELLVRVDDDRHEVRFRIKEMILRPQWEKIEQHRREQMDSPSAESDREVSLSRQR